MSTKKYVYSQVLEHLPRHKFETCINRYNGNKGVKTFSCRDQFLAMTFGQLTHRESLRDTTMCLKAHRDKMYHLGFKSLPILQTLSHANENRDWRIYRDLADVLIAEARDLYIDDPNIAEDLSGACYAIDASCIDLCLSLFHWAPLDSKRASVKLHMVMDLRGSIPAFFDITNTTVNDVRFLDQVLFESGAFYVMDKGYLDFGRLYSIHKAGAFFVTRAKTNTKMKRRYSKTADKTTGVRCDQIVYLTGKDTPQKYPDTLRRVKYYDVDRDDVYVFLTNNNSVSAESIALLYKNRWQIELFFKWIKQHLKIKSFWGRSANAVKTQICIALCAYLMVAILKKRLCIKRNIYEILQILSVSMFDKIGLPELFSQYRLPKHVKSSEITAQLFDI